jgi:hypothetical protein
MSLIPLAGRNRPGSVLGARVRSRRRSRRTSLQEIAFGADFSAPVVAARGTPAASGAVRLEDLLRESLRFLGRTTCEGAPHHDPIPPAIDRELMARPSDQG